MPWVLRLAAHPAKAPPRTARVMQSIPSMDFKPLVTLLAVVNPLAIVPFFIHPAIARFSS